MYCAIWQIAQVLYAARCWCGLSVSEAGIQTSKFLVRVVPHLLECRYLLAKSPAEDAERLVGQLRASAGAVMRSGARPSIMSFMKRELVVKEEPGAVVVIWASQIRDDFFKCNL